MGARTWMLVYVEGGDARAQLAARPALDRAQSARVAEQLFAADELQPLADGSLAWTAPPDDELLVGCFGGLTVLAAKEFALDRPSGLDARFLEHAQGRDVILHAMHSAADWLAVAHWRGGRLLRALSVAPDDGVIEDQGSRLAFEAPFWAGAHPADDPEELAAGEEPYPLPFHPLELGEAALREFLGYQLEGIVDASLLEPDTVPLLRFKRKPRRKPSWFSRLW
ncbi:DUF6928 family protein [Paucibacter sp. DJ2R-2]|uniref:DUF6928 family protein n=1 Tax=Paucibacter sp. DJ2R-2 TaxID=2893558 RepID=UPI0021E48A25|nr:hypothetical protein [Paucibacter sp. DJ2R-2]MCV2419064.1 hypothetical protein [Paucibacter sp. DJ4R-1]MCV2437981.1 hypothetical protein [Paucibacter sp. DJ2R-2]